MIRITEKMLWTKDRFIIHFTLANTRRVYVNPGIHKGANYGASKADVVRPSTRCSVSLSSHLMDVRQFREGVRHPGVVDLFTEVKDKQQINH